MITQNFIFITNTVHSIYLNKKQEIPEYILMMEDKHGIE